MRFDPLVVRETHSDVSRWENGAQPISALADRLLRMVVATRGEYPTPDLRAIDNERAEPLAIRVVLGRKGWRIVEPKAKSGVAA